MSTVDLRGSYGNERYHSGGGSGYIQQAELSGAYLPYSYLQVTIGEAGSSSSVSDGSVNVVSAEGGDYGYSFDGGSGYSGGGAGGYSSDIAGAGWSLTAVTKYLRPKYIISVVH